MIPIDEAVADVLGRIQSFRPNLDMPIPQTMVEYWLHTHAFQVLNNYLARENRQFVLEDWMLTSFLTKTPTGPASDAYIPGAFSGDYLGQFYSIQLPARLIHMPGVFPVVQVINYFTGEEYTPIIDPFTYLRRQNHLRYGRGDKGRGMYFVYQEAEYLYAIGTKNGITQDYDPGARIYLFKKDGDGLADPTTFFNIRAFAYDVSVFYNGSVRREVNGIPIYTHLYGELIDVVVERAKRDLYQIEVDKSPEGTLDQQE